MQSACKHDFLLAGERPDLVPGEALRGRARLLPVVAAARQIHHLRQPQPACKAIRPYFQSGIHHDLLPVSHSKGQE